MTTASNHDNAADAKSTKKGISRPVEVVVRPANLGLGFGNFTEATQLKLPYSKDNYFFAVQSVSEYGTESLPVIPTPLSR